MHYFLEKTKCSIFGIGTPVLHLIPRSQSTSLYVRDCQVKCFCVQSKKSYVTTYVRVLDFKFCMLPSISLPSNWVGPTLKAPRPVGRAPFLPQGPYICVHIMSNLDSTTSLTLIIPIRRSLIEFKPLAFQTNTYTFIMYSGRIIG